MSATPQPTLRCHGPLVRPFGSSRVPCYGDLSRVPGTELDIWCCESVTHAKWVSAWLAKQSEGPSLKISVDFSLMLPTYSGRLVNLIDPDPDTISLVDIVQGLSLTNRYTGQSAHGLSVAEHSVRLAVAARGMDMGVVIGREVILHDAHEAYICDLPRQIKHHPWLAGYRDIEQRLDSAIRKKFLMEPEMPKVVHDLDRAICQLEIESGLFPGKQAFKGVPVDNGTVANAERLHLALTTNRPDGFPRSYGWSPEIARQWMKSELAMVGLFY